MDCTQPPPKAPPLPPPLRCFRLMLQRFDIKSWREGRNLARPNKQTFAVYGS